MTLVTVVSLVSERPPVFGVRLTRPVMCSGDGATTDHAQLWNPHKRPDPVGFGWARASRKPIPLR
jgi:hypothetical protein